MDVPMVSFAENIYIFNMARVTFLVSECYNVII
jgi:hypothetical protein